MEKERNDKLGFIQEFNTLEIVIGDKNDDFDELKRLVTQLWKDNSENEEDGSGYEANSENTTDLARYDAKWEQNLLRILSNSLDNSLNEVLYEEKRNENVFVKIIDLEERRGSLIILVTFVANLINGFEKYGALRQSYDHFVQDVRRVFSGIGHKKKVKITLKETLVSSKSNGGYSFLKQLRSINIFWSISGASTALLKNSYTDHNKYKSLGAAILFTGCFAFISCCFALSYLTNQWFIIIPIAFLWSLTIINIDMMIINTMVKYEKKSFNSFLGFASRIFLGVAIAFALSVPVELTLLNDEIKDEIDRYDRQNLEQEVSKSIEKFARLEELKNLKIEREKQFNDEMQGKPSASGKRGYGPIAEKIESQIYDLTTEIEVLEQKKDSVESIVRKEINGNTDQNNKYGFLASYRALHRLQYASDDKSVLHMTWGIRVLLLLIELLPIISKLLMRRGSYDSRYEYEEYKSTRINDRLRKNIP
jgi:hypothetical protein